MVVAGGAKVVPLFPGAEASRDVAGWPESDPDEALVLRRELFERLAKAGQVTIVSAPAGSGKTCLLSSWIAQATPDAVRRGRPSGATSATLSGSGNP